MHTKFLFKPKLLVSCTLIAMAGISPLAMAEEALDAPYTFWDSVKEGKPMTNFRLRYETVEQDGFKSAPSNTTQKLDNANGLTLRSLIGWHTAPFNNFSFAAQVTDVHEFTSNFNDKRNNLNEPGSTNYPAIVDPSFTDINQLFVDWTGIKNTTVRLGRQQVILDNARFVGDIGFRQNMQVFDGVSVMNKSITDTDLFVGHYEQVRQINTQLRQGNMDILNAKYRISPSESLVGYGYLVDVANLSWNNGTTTAGSTVAQGGNGLGANQDLVKSAKTDASSKTFGLRLDGARALNPDWKGLYTLEYAKQSDYASGSPFIDAHYIKVGAGAGYAGWSVRLDHEVLSSNNGKYAFQTPLGTNHLFQGWADVFLATPRQGIKDTFVTIAGNIERVKVNAEYHVFKADEDFQSIGKLGDNYGTEFDASLAYAPSKEWLTKFEYAKFNEQDVYGSLTNAARKGDKQIIWLTAMYSF